MLETQPFSKTRIVERRSPIAGQALTYLRQHASPYWLVVAGSFAGTLVNGPLVLSAGIGLVVHQQLTQLTPQQWQHIAASLERRWSLPAPRAKVWLLSAATVMATYGATALWSDTHSFWLSMLLGGQSLLAVAMVGLLLRPAAPTPDCSAPEPSTTPLEASLSQLVDADPLQRLIGVRQVIRQATQAANADYLPGQTVRSHLIDCLHLMLAQEDEPMVRTAIREGIELLREKPQLASGAPAVHPPLRQRQPSAAKTPITQPPSRVRRTSVEYVEP